MLLEQRGPEYQEINLEDGDRLSQTESTEEAKAWSQETQHIQEAGSGLT